LGCLKLHIENKPTIRLAYSKKEEKPIKNRGSYYPFGLQQKGYNNTVSGNKNDAAERYNYLGQEEQPELGLNWLTFRYRNYMPEIGRFFGSDPITEEFLSISNYQFAHNSPVWKIELEGLEGYALTGGDLLNFEPVAGHTMLPTSDPGFVGSSPKPSSTITTDHGNGITTTHSTFVAENGQAHVAKGSVHIKDPNNLGEFNGEGRVLGASAYNNNGDGAAPLALSVGAEASVLEANADLRIGSPVFGALFEGKGSVLSARANADVGVFTGEGGTFGPKLDLNAGFFTAEGEVSSGMSFLGIRTTTTFGASAPGSVHAGITYGATFNSETGIFTIEGSEHFGFLIGGEKVGVKFEIPIGAIIDEFTDK